MRRAAFLGSIESLRKSRIAGPSGPDINTLNNLCFKTRTPGVREKPWFSFASHTLVEHFG